MDRLVHRITPLSSARQQSNGMIRQTTGCSRQTKRECPPRRRPAALEKEDTLVKLTDTQLIVLAAAANRDGGSILPLPGTLKLNRETADGVLKELLKKKLVAERPATGPATVWPDSKAGGPVTLAITPAGLGAIAAEATAPRPGDHPKAKAAARTAKRTAPKPGRSPSRNSDGRKARPNSAALAGLRPGSKQAKLLALLQDPTGASVAEMIKATDWQAHSVRGVISGVFKKKLGLRIVSAKEARGRVYRMAASGK